MARDSFEDIGTLGELLGWRARNQGDQPAFAFLGRNLEVEDTDSFGTLAASAAASARCLRDMKVRPGDPVIVANDPGLGFVRALWGIWLAGAVAVPSYPPTSQSRARHLARVAAVTGARVVVASQGRSESGSDQVLQACAWLDHDATDLRPAADWEAPPVSPEDPALIQFTSGSISEPKGVVLSHRNILANARDIQFAFVHSSKSRGLIWLPPYHDMGLMGGVVQPVFAGFRTALMSPRTFLRDPLNWLKAVTLTQASTSGGPNFAYESCINLPAAQIQAAGLDLASWQVAFNGAEPVSATTLQRFAKTFEPYGFSMHRFMSCYGLAEASLYVVGTPRMSRPKVLRVDRANLTGGIVRVSYEPGAGTRLVVSCGTPGQAVRIVNPDTREPCRMAEIGEIWVRGAGVGKRYCGRPRLTEATFGAFLDGDEGRYLRTGDLGFLHSGELFVTGRIKNLLIVNGRNHDPEDIETTVRARLGAKEGLPAAAIAIPRDDGHNAAEGVVIVQEVGRAMASADADRRIGIIRAAVAAEHGIPAYAVLLVPRGSIPKTPSGKLRRNKCREQLLAGRIEPLYEWHESGKAPTPASAQQHALAIEIAPPRLDGLDRAGREHALKDWLIHVVSQVIQVQVQDLSADTHFGLYGIDSLTAISVTAYISEALNIDLDDAIIWDYPNFTLLSALLAEHMAPRYSPRPSVAAPEAVDAGAAR